MISKVINPLKDDKQSVCSFRWMSMGAARRCTKPRCGQFESLGRCDHNIDRIRHVMWRHCRHERGADVSLESPSLTAAGILSSRCPQGSRDNPIGACTNVISQPERECYARIEVWRLVENPETQNAARGRCHESASPHSRRGSKVV